MIADQWTSTDGRINGRIHAIESDSLNGARVEQVDEHHLGPLALFIFEYECYPEAKILSSTELRALHQKLGGWPAVGRMIGASEGFARQNGQKQ